VGCQGVPPLPGELHAAPIAAKVNGSDKSGILKVVEGLSVDVQVVLRHDAEGSNGGQRSAVFAVQLVGPVAVHDQLAFVAARQVEIARQPVTRVVVVSVPVVVHALAAVLAPVTVARVISRIEHGCPPDKALGWGVREGGRTVAARGDSGGRRTFGALRRATFRRWVRPPCVSTARSRQPTKTLLMVLYARAGPHASWT
jgi:hypothetical protein